MNTVLANWPSQYGIDLHRNSSMWYSKLKQNCWATTFCSVSNEQLLVSASKRSNQNKDWFFDQVESDKQHSRYFLNIRWKNVNFSGCCMRRDRSVRRELANRVVVMDSMALKMREHGDKKQLILQINAELNNEWMSINSNIWVNFLFSLNIKTLDALSTFTIKHTKEFLKQIRKHFVAQLSADLNGFWSCFCYCRFSWRTSFRACVCVCFQLIAMQMSCTRHTIRRTFSFVYVVLVCKSRACVRAPSISLTHSSSTYDVLF